MLTPKALSAWLAACRELTGYDGVPGYSRLRWRDRKRLDHLALWRGLRSSGFWRACIVVLNLCLVAQILCWQFDLAGWRHDLLKALPILLATPWLAAARKRHLRDLLDSTGDHSQSA
jgi:hypothetical protein